ncbi:hypothetical protein H6G97_36925 [Nostoc flagelliforme FACHB-838]|uniref:Transposase n=1 Tax=Nostoc flagelliforme FACHB-838 TaxID=2692904 RepID=A0ABR8E019_9NOSO|nr:hypothetical protein [Nostoc flagelliforme]MBD2534753.1 hypothetical protein [Nostoc flagelliforme FACHB-838]
MITASGVKPTVKVIWPRDNFWIYGAIEPLTGDHNITSTQNWMASVFNSSWTGYLNN